MKKFLEKFKAFALRGNVMDMAIGVIMAFILFCLLKAVNKITSIGAKKEEEPAPTTKVCPFCRSEIDIEATRCPHCTSILNEEKKEEL
nr:MscL family protein [uncultured Blautia sp.]